MAAADPRKIAVISCVNDEAKYAECLLFIKALRVPPGFIVEPLPVRDASGMAQGYNTAMRLTDAKYKIYTHQDVLIVHRNFLVDMVAIFEQNPAVGIMGVVGAKTLPASGVWWESPDKTGKIYDSAGGKVLLADWGGVYEAFAEVQAVDGLLMATQYDLPWREDLFDGWHYYDTSQCMEFIRAGCSLSIPRQEQPWCLHDCGVTPIDASYHQARERFCREYINKERK
ncbi:glycosyltransferase family protein [Paenibacillus sp. sptzw28]|uniref:glycosyltransferase family protein n=1 Tax=Paenibacillus sp. sptzw28 TaxID=715179 RepID=UPI001C6E4031|nr:glycosyltransferase family protein [Paenibacillus sp. sptzw28]QYR19854.1 glycosyltransferase family protein [Paenibacillus sp. sptzw28]